MEKGEDTQKHTKNVKYDFYNNFFIVTLFNSNHSVNNKNSKKLVFTPFRTQRKFIKLLFLRLIFCLFFTMLLCYCCHATTRATATVKRVKRRAFLGALQSALILEDIWEAGPSLLLCEPTGRLPGGKRGGDYAFCVFVVNKVQ